MCIPHSINCTPRDSALYSKATKRTISVESLRGDWIYWIYPIGFRSIVSLNIGWWMAIICFFFFFPVCVYGNEGFFRFGIVVERPEIFFSFEDLLWKIYSKSFLFFCLCGKWIFFFFSFCAVKSVGEKSCIEIYGIFLSCFWIVVLYNIPCSLSSEREILLLFFSLDNRYGWLYL